MGRKQGRDDAERRRSASENNLCGGNRNDVRRADTV